MEVDVGPDCFVGFCVVGGIIVEKLVEGRLAPSREVALVGERQSQDQVYLQVFLEIGAVLEVNPGGEDVE